MGNSIAHIGGAVAAVHLLTAYPPLVKLMIAEEEFVNTFALMLRYIPDQKVPWRDVAAGSVATALLFTLGKTLIGIYLGRASVGSTYGAAGSLMVIIVWVYYSAQIFFFGAEFTHVWAKMRMDEFEGRK